MEISYWADEIPESRVSAWNRRASQSDHIGGPTVMLPRDIAESLRHYLAKTQRTPDGMETYRAEAEDMDEELSALNKALKEKP
jgi:hypothetical protein